MMTAFTTLSAAINGRALLPLLALCLAMSGCRSPQADTARTAPTGGALYLTHELLRSENPAVSFSGAPELLAESPFGQAVWFDGVDDAIFVDENPLRGLSSFTVEVLFRPDSGGSLEPRFLHIGEVSHDRMMLEARLTPEGEWVFDSFLRAGEDYLVLIDHSLRHPVGEWAHLALVVDDGHARNYVNGTFEMEGQLEFHPIDSGGLSIGVRANKVHWFKGAIHSVRITPRALAPDDFTR